MWRLLFTGCPGVAPWNPTLTLTVSPPRLPLLSELQFCVAQVGSLRTPLGQVSILRWLSDFWSALQTSAMGLRSSLHHPPTFSNGNSSVSKTFFYVSSGVARFIQTTLRCARKENNFFINWWRDLSSLISSLTCWLEMWVERIQSNLINSSHILESLFKKNIPSWTSVFSVSDLGLIYSLCLREQSEGEGCSLWA